MKSRNIRTPSYLALGLLALSPCWACNDDPAEPEFIPQEAIDQCDGAGEQAPQMQACRRNIECVGGHVCEKPPGALAEDFGCCRGLTCTSNADCDTGSYCSRSTSLCLSNQICEQDGPDAESCTESESCQWNREGAICAVPPLVASCEVVPAQLHGISSEPIPFSVLALDAGGEPLVSPALNLSATIGELLNSESLVVTCNDGEGCTGTLTATIDGGSCSANVVVESAPGGAKVSFFDRVHGGEVTADVYVVTDFRSYRFEAASSPISIPASERINSVTVRAEGYDWRTLVAPPTGNLVLPLSVTVGGGGGVTGEVDFSGLVGQIEGDIKLGSIGLSIARAPYELDLQRLFGLSERRFVVGGDGLGGNIWRAYPSATTFSFGTIIHKSMGLALARPGKRLLWSVASQLRLASLPSSYFAINENTPSARGSLDLLRGTQAKFSAIGQTVLIVDGPLPPPRSDGSLVYGEFNTIALPQVTPGFIPEYAPHWSIEIEIPPVPTVLGSPYRVLLVAAVDVPARGLIPLSFLELADGLAGDAPDGLVQAERASTGPGVAEISFAPPHAGLEDHPLVLVAMAFSGALDGGDPVPKMTLVLRDPVFGSATFGSEQWLAVPPVSFLADDDSLEVDESAEPPHLTQLDAHFGDQAWEILVTGLPADGLALRGLLPDDVVGDLSVSDIRALDLGPSVDTSLGASTLLGLREAVQASTSTGH